MTVVIEQPRPTARFASLIVERLELAPRETDVTIQVLRGASRAHTARTLAISEQTVADVVSAVFRKAAVHSRRQSSATSSTRRISSRCGVEPPPRAPTATSSTNPPGRRTHPEEGMAAAPASFVPSTQHRPQEGPRCPCRPQHREDLFTHPHTALRRGLLDLHPRHEQPSTGPTPTASRRFTDRWGVMRRLLESHARHEDNYIYQLLADADPQLIAASRANTPTSKRRSTHSATR